MVEMNNIWEGKKTLVTGYEGFIGSWLVKELLKLNSSVVGIDILTNREETILSDDEKNKLKIFQNSVEDFNMVSHVINKEKIDFVFHLAAKSLVGYGYDNPSETFSTNIKGTWNVLEACRKSSNVKGVVIASSDKAYGLNDRLPYREDFALKGIYPYDVSKSCADLLANAYFKTYNLPVSITRCGNIFGPGDYNFSRLVPDAIKSILKDETLLIRSDGKFVRDYIYIKDVVNGYLMLGAKMIDSECLGEAFNLSNEKPLSVIEVVKLIYKLMDKTPNCKILDQAKHEIKKQHLDSTKARKLLKWKSQYDFKKSLKETINWYENIIRG